MQCSTNIIYPAIIIGGLNSTGSSTLAKKLSNSLDLKYIYAGGIMRQLCVEIGDCPQDSTDPHEFEKNYKIFSKRLLNDPSINKKLDNKLLEYIKTENTPMCVESRTAAALCTQQHIPVILKIWITSNLETRIKRFKIKHPDTTLNDTQIKELIEERDKAEIQQYLTQYNVDLTKPHLYNDIVLDTSNLSVEESYFAITKDPMFQKRIPLLEQFTPEYNMYYRYKCKNCGYVYEGPTPPQTCPKCGASSPDNWEEIEC